MLKRIAYAERFKSERQYEQLVWYLLLLVLIQDSTFPVHIVDNGFLSLTKYDSAKRCAPLVKQ